MEKARRTEKTPLTREFLDMDTDEEDFGRQGSFLYFVFYIFFYTILKKLDNCKKNKKINRTYKHIKIFYTKKMFHRKH